MILFQITDISLINYFASIFLNFAIFLVPIVGAISLTRH